MIAEEIFKISELSCLPCSEFIHLLVGGKLFDPVEGEIPLNIAREGHAFVEDQSPAYQAFISALPTAIYRKIDCVAGVCFVVPNEFAPDFERVAKEQHIEIEYGVITNSKTILDYTVPVNFTWVVTLVNVRLIPPVNDPSLTVGDWRSEDFDASGTTKAKWQVNGNEVTQEDSTYFCPLNQESLFAFKGGDRVKLIVERAPGSDPPTQQIVVAVNSYLAPPKAFDRLARNLTQIDSSFS